MRLDKDFYTSHIKDGEKVVKMRRILDKIEIVLNKHLIQCSDFLDPYEVYLAKSILNRFDDLKYLEYGGYDAAERRIIIIYPYYLELEEVDEYLACIKLLGTLRACPIRIFRSFIKSRYKEGEGWRYFSSSGPYLCNP